ncbi:MAG: UDP-N-acetylglucosamine 2-epimerase [Lentisphaeraceae bacterium]|nr:UDP-N-acetylglucosamine 2-epimerase [Lentisphaeraceae bacterium]
MNLAFITVARSDFSRLRPTLEAVQNSDEHDLKLIVAGNHSSSVFGSSLEEIETAGFEISERINFDGDMSESSAKILTGLSTYFQNESIDACVILGDRFEMLAAAQAASFNHVPIIHIGGGYTTLGAIDDQVRDAITVLSSIHLVATSECMSKVVMRGAKSEKVFLTGAPDLELVRKVEPLSRSQFCKEVSFSEESFALVTFHPETKHVKSEHLSAVESIKAFLTELSCHVLITAPCADPGNEEILSMIQELESLPHVNYRQSLGGRLYVNALHHTDVILGNSSSGIIEAGSFAVPVINVGNRQAGREQNNNVINSSFELSDLKKAYESIKDKDFVEGLESSKNLYGDGFFAQKFIEILNRIK